MTQNQCCRDTLPGRDDDGDADAGGDLQFWRTASAKINVFESSTDVENQFLMNVSANIIIFDVNMHVNMLFFMKVLAKINVFESATYC